MRNPLKIIHKFKNDNKRTQYQVYIFIGQLINDDIKKILDQIVNKDFYSTLNDLSKKKYNILANYYGNFWYKYFFISYHLKSQKDLILKNNSKRKNIISKYGKEWFKKHFEVSIKDKILYSFASNYYNYLVERNKLKSKTRKIELDFRTYNISANLQKGGNDDIKIIDEDDEEEITAEDLDDEVIEDFNLDELTKLYSTENIESNKEIQNTSKLISKAINDKSWEKKDTTKIKYNTALDNISYDILLDDIYNKIYITDQYIFLDDTIKMMRKKIAVSIPINPKFGKNIKLIPEYQYFWSEYMIKGKMDYIMLGQKWIRRNELLKIDIIPNTNLKVYENLRNNLSYLKDSFGYKIKREDDETNTLEYYSDYITNNEIFMLDVFNDLGLNYDTELNKRRNLYEVYINIYFPLITYDRFELILNLLNGKTEKEQSLNENNFGIIKNDIKLETEIYTTIEKAKKDIKKYDKYFWENYIIQSIIHVNIDNPKNKTGTVSTLKFNLYRIFDNFIVNETYPFIQYQLPDAKLTYKFYTKTKQIKNNNILSKWFENAPYGITFKIKIDIDKYISVNFQENGRIEYKKTWKEIDKATMKDIINTYDYIRDLLTKINLENKKVKIMRPDDSKFKYAFINTIQKFTLPKDFKINHDDLSEFSRFFFPYVAMVIEPKKRISNKNIKINTTSKYGTYLRYKRISKYENRTRMHLRILYFLRNFELTDKELIDEIAKQFNITMDVAAKELDFAREKYNKVIKKSKKGLKKFKTLPKSKPPGIGIDVQGRDRERYKIRITGARSKDQLNKIITFMKILIFLYSETYLFKKTKYQQLKITLGKLNKIAKRRNKVNDIVEYNTNIKKVKAITGLDKKRLGFKPEEGQNQWTRSCQNSGKDKRRRPIIVQGNNMNQLLKKGYKYNKKTQFFEKTVNIVTRGQKHKVVLRAVKLADSENQYNYYTCDPSDNGQHMYIGFLSRGNNPNDLCMPCCFIKDQLKSNNKKKKNYYLKCIGEQSKDELVEKIKSDNLGDKLYILQDTNKIQEGRFINLPEQLDNFFNKLWNNDHIIKNHYLLESKSGYFFKYTVKHTYYQFLSAISNIYDISIDELKLKMINFLENDKNDKVFTYLNNGDIKESFKTKDKYINYIKKSNYLEYDIIGELICLPNIINKLEKFIFILKKKVDVIKNPLEKDIINEKYYLKCLNLENSYKMNTNNEFIILIKDSKFYFPIYRVYKNPKIHKKINLQKIYSAEENIINELKKYYGISCLSNIINKINNFGNLEAKILINKLEKNNIKIKNQLIDNRNKCKYLLLENNLLLPTKPSGIYYKYSFNNMTNIISKNKLNLTQTINYLKKINKILKLDYIPVYLYYNKKINTKIKIISLELKNNLIIPIKTELISLNKIKKMGLVVKFHSLEEIIDKNIINNVIINDSRNNRVKTHLYNSEGYNIYRLELSLFLDKNYDIRNKIIKIVRNINISEKNKKYELRKILFNIIDKKLKKKIIQQGGDFKLIKKLPNLSNYKISNIRNYCNIYKSKDKCENNNHCGWHMQKCHFQLTETMAIDYVNKIIEEMVLDKIGFKEIIQEDNYYVSDIVNYYQYTNRPNQRIIKESNFNLKNIMSELFGSESIPKIGKKQFKHKKLDNDIINEDIIKLGKQLIQPIISNLDSILRAYVNCYYWINNSLYDIESRNLGFKSELQTQITYQFKAHIIDYIQNNKKTEFNKYLSKYFNSNKNFFNSAINNFRKSNFNTDGKIILFVLSYMFDYPIVVYDNYNNVKFIYFKGQIKLTNKNIKKFTKNDKLKSTIFLKFDYEGNNSIPFKIYSIYYL